MDFEYFSRKKIPTASDFSPAAVKKALFKKASGHWSFKYTVPLFFAGILYVVLFGLSGAAFLALLSLFSIATLSWIVNFYFKSEKFKKKYIERLNLIVEIHTKRKLKSLQDNLKRVNEMDAAKQLEQFIRKFHSLEEILKTKFDPDSLTYGRYYGIIQEVFLSGIDNLTDILVTHKTIQSIDKDYINERLKKLGAITEKTMPVQKEIDALNRSLESHTSQKEKIQQLMAENETALTQLDEATIAISEINRTKDKQAEIDMENSMKALTELKERSYIYSR